MATPNERRLSMAQVKPPRRPSQAQEETARRSSKAKVEAGRRSSKAQIEGSRRPSKAQVGASRRSSKAQVEASRRSSKAQIDAAAQPRDPSSFHVDPQQYVSAPEQSRRASNKFTAVEIVNYMNNIRKPEQPWTPNSSPFARNRGWYWKRCCVCLLMLVSMLTIALAIYLLTGPAGKWLIESEQTTAPTEPYLVPPKERRGVNTSEEFETPVTTNAAAVTGVVTTECEMNATIDHCPSNNRHSSTWYVCPGNGRPCQPAWKPSGRCLGPRGPRFSTQKLCERSCFKKEDPCQTGPESCPCTEGYRVFNYVHTNDKGCIPLEEGRCLVKNIRGYKSKDECLNRCQGQAPSDAICDLEEVNNERCTWRDKIYRFYYDVQKKSCLPWNDDICQPNTFSTIQLCMQMCN
ncbi:uncharacterized protein LOC135366876 [Ornithodoros turicata]|uniref:uncharacterized protein LOC135366876 n=1 Tax=Ornithodoros turicata TaxID=34597 RepID=UPI003139212A